MKLDIIKGFDKQTGNNVVLGWSFTAENKEEEKNLSLVCGMIFFGLEDDGSYPHYAGRTDNPESGLVQKIWYNIPQHRAGITRGTITLTPANPEAQSMLKDWNA